MFLRANRVAYFQPVRRVRKNGRLALGASQRFIKSGSILNHIEAILISTAEPPHNRQGGRFGEEVEQYLQYRDHQAFGLDMESMVQGPLVVVDLSGRVKSLSPNHRLLIALRA